MVMPECFALSLGWLQYRTVGVKTPPCICSLETLALGLGGKHIYSFTEAVMLKHKQLF